MVKLRYHVRYKYVPKFSRWVIILAVLAIFLAVSVAANLDYQVMQHAPFVSGQEAQYLIYGFWFTAVMFMFGFGIACALGYVYRASKAGGVLFGTVVVATALLIISGFEDCMYFLLGQGSFPANNVNWDWMIQAKWWGFWNTTDVIAWLSIWLLILALFLGLVLKFAKRYEH